MQTDGWHFPSSSSTSTPMKYPRQGPSYRPLNSSPLASPNALDDSPVASRRRMQFKSKIPCTPLPSSSRASARVINSSGGSVFTSSSNGPPPLDPQKAFLRDRFKARCFERAVKARNKAVKGRRYVSEPSSDGFDEAMDDDDDEEDDDTVMADELFRRIVNQANRREKHSFRRSYAQEVGSSSFDPALENPEEWENELLESFQTSGPSPNKVSRETSEDTTPLDVAEQELQAYAEEYAALADFEDIPPEELFSLSDVEELENPNGTADDDVDMS